MTTLAAALTRLLCRPRLTAYRPRPGAVYAGVVASYEHPTN